MVRFIKKLEFDADKNTITITDNVESYEIDGSIKDFCPKILDRWLGYLDRVKKEYANKHKGV